MAMMTAPDQIPEDNRDQLIDGANRARVIAAETMRSVRDIVGFVQRPQ